MKVFLLICSFISFSYAAEKDIYDDELNFSTQTYENHDIEEGQAIAQESEEEIANFVEDYVKKDISLKGYFFIEEKSSGEILKLKYSRIKKVSIDENEKKVEVEFKDLNSKKYDIDFYLEGLWGNLDIKKIEFKNNNTATKNQKKEKNELKNQK